MKESLIRQYSFSREELRNRLLQALEDSGIQIQGEVKLTFTDWGCCLEESVPVSQEADHNHNKGENHGRETD